MLLLQLQQTPLHLSSKCGHVDIVNVLLSHGADIHVKGMVSKYFKKCCVLVCIFMYVFHGNYISYTFSMSMYDSDILQHEVT